MVRPAGGSHAATWFGLVHMSNITSIGASKHRLMTKRSVADKSSANRSHVATTTAFLMNSFVSFAACSDANDIVISIFVFLPASEKLMVTGNIGGRSS